jgi:hypothetical protein
MNTEQLYENHKKKLCSNCMCTENQCKGITICADCSTVCNKGRCKNNT